MAHVVGEVVDVRWVWADHVNEHDANAAALQAPDDRYLADKATEWRLAAAYVENRAVLPLDLILDALLEPSLRVFEVGRSRLHHIIVEHGEVVGGVQLVGIEHDHLGALRA